MKMNYLGQRADIVPDEALTNSLAHLSFLIILAVFPLCLGKGCERGFPWGKVCQCCAFTVGFRTTHSHLCSISLVSEMNFVWQKYVLDIGRNK
ncbi:hypothetical protein CDAR_183551 [Caerostris darwini]|uniref:Uncharacterized protein n=1 Tax=Caerostris darwini TaxID=1538125 RepID=A0AAV4R181_9ARAC|nr:hypothetical protein CDAR_183551 [Caerostris darwini]